MEKLLLATQLDELLSESVEHASARAAAKLVLSDSDALVLYGAGTLGKSVFQKLRDAGVVAAAFADDTPGRDGEKLQGVEIMTPQRALAEFDGRALFVVTILNPALRYLEAKRRLEKMGARVISFLDLAWKYPESFLPYGQFELPQQLLTKAARIRDAFQLWEDDESRRQFLAHLRFRLFLDYETLPPNSWDNYFPDLLPPLPPATTFIDCGAYDGDTVDLFLKHQQSQFHEIYAFEPDEKNYQRLREYVSALKPDAADRIHTFKAGVSNERAKLAFNAAGNTSSAFAAEGQINVETIPVQEVVASTGDTVYIKFDVEGAEWSALEGCRRLIEGARTLLAVSIYHRPDDLWELPLYLKSLNPNYKLYLRTQGEDGMDVICYALPHVTS